MGGPGRASVQSFYTAAGREGFLEDSLPRNKHSPATVVDQTAGAVRVWLRAGIYRAVFLLLLTLAILSSGMLVMHHFGSKLPGCGPEAGCDKLQNSAWGRTPVIGWPIAFVGLAYFLALRTSLAVKGRSLGGARVIAWLGGAASAGFAGLMVYLGEFCLYCALTHGFNLLALAALETHLYYQRRWRELGDSSMDQRKPSGRRGMHPVAVFACVFGVSTAALAGANAVHASNEAKKNEAERAESARTIIEKSATSTIEQPVDRWGSNGFTGRYRKGPETAAIRVVVLTDYQCPDCRRVEGEIEAVLKARTDMSLSVKHFPMCVDCNKYAGRTLHGNACWAARAAEAAGILGGDEAFFKMHSWLFENKGEFAEQATLDAGVRAAGLEPGLFTGLMKSPQTLKNVQADVEDGIALGLYSTPMVFINGVEFKGWQVPGAFAKTVEQVAAASPPAQTAVNDRPVLAAQRYIEDWRASPVFPRQPDTVAWPTGLAAGESPTGAEALVEVVVYGDFQESNTARLETQIQEAMKGRTNVRYTFRHYPIARECNPSLPPNVSASALHPMACKAAQAAEAAGQLGGNEGYWKMHRWLMENWNKLGDQAIAQAAARFGWEGDAFAAAMASPATAAAIAEDCRTAKAVGLRSIPHVFVNNKLVPRTWRDGDNVMKRVIDEASTATK